MDELLEGVIHSQRGELEKRKAEFVDLQVEGERCTAGRRVERAGVAFLLRFGL